jgi:putative membrane protein
VRPLAKFVGCLPIIITLGLFTLVINAFLFWLTGQIGLMFNVGFTVDGFWPAFLGGLVVSAVSIVMGMIFRDELKGRKK